ncbi:MAG: hydrogenase formation protein HypD, partial [Synechococcaceae bacterium WB8_1B_136]|nr:hydrogenase formation protein HypD [Synechococcaceae bacterium WB8_1B_136]
RQAVVRGAQPQAAPGNGAEPAPACTGPASKAAPAAGAPHLCLSGQVLQGLLKPPDCPSFGGACTPETPLGAPMVSSEGACAAYHRFRAPA